MQRSSSVEWVGLVLLERVGSLRGKRICAWLRLLMIGDCLFVFFPIVTMNRGKTKSQLQLPVGRVLRDNPPPLRRAAPPGTPV